MQERDLLVAKQKSRLESRQVRSNLPTSHELMPLVLELQPWIEAAALEPVKQSRR
jgi:hypothetical protein